ncbi:MAG: hypothetical protein V3T09_00640 [bacterium]
MIKRRFNYKEGRLIPRKKHSKPFRFVGIGIIIMAVIIFIFYKLMVK